MAFNACNTWRCILVKWMAVHAFVYISVCWIVTLHITNISFNSLLIRDSDSFYSLSSWQLHNFANWNAIPMENSRNSVRISREDFTRTANVRYRGIWIRKALKFSMDVWSEHCKTIMRLILWNDNQLFFSNGIFICTYCTICILTMGLSYDLSM